MEKYNLDRFLKAQEGVYETALKELKAGKKQSHWMWFCFPQIKGLGMSHTAHLYGIKDMQEAKDYLGNEVLKARLVEMCQTLLALETNDVEQVFGYPDYLKLKSSLVLFSWVNPDEEVFSKTLDKFFKGETCPQTVDMVKGKHNNE